MRRMTFNEIALLAFALIVVALFSLFTVPQTSQALIVRLGNPVRAISEPGLHMKIPLIDSVIYVDNRILDLESGAEEVIASDQKRLVVEAFARYRIARRLSSVWHRRRGYSLCHRTNAGCRFGEVHDRDVCRRP